MQKEPQLARVARAVAAKLLLQPSNIASPNDLFAHIRSTARCPKAQFEQRPPMPWEASSKCASDFLNVQSGKSTSSVVGKVQGQKRKIHIRRRKLKILK